MDNSLQTKTPPKNAFRFDAPLEFAKHSADSMKDTKSRPITMLARTRKVLNHGWWGRCVHDFDGMVHADRVILDYCHKDIIGYADQFTVDDQGLTLAGRVESVQPDDAAELLLKRMDKGIPYQASIYFDEAVLEYVPDGYSAEVNGETIPGPLTVFRKWLLRASSACPHGYDSDSNTKSNEQTLTTKFSWANPMTKETSTPDTPAVDPRAELKQFTDRFGVTDGADYFTRAVSMADATAEHLTKLSTRHETELAALKVTNTEAITKLTAERDAIAGQRDAALAKIEAAKLSIGEADGVDVGKPGQLGSPAKPATSMTEARLAAKQAKK